MICNWRTNFKLCNANMKVFGFIPRKQSDVVFIKLLHLYFSGILNLDYFCQ